MEAEVLTCNKKWVFGICNEISKRDLKVDSHCCRRVSASGSELVDSPWESRETAEVTINRSRNNQRK